MCIGKSDLTVGPLVKQLVAGERPIDQPGVLSRYDTPDRLFVPAPMQHNLDQLDFPRYEWFDLSIYRNYNGYQLVPVIASRGCRWSRCTFCAERFYWRIRSAQNFVNELEWLVDQGCTLFMFNESDLNGMPEKVIEICDEIIRRDIRVRLTGQLRIQKTSDGPFYGSCTKRASSRCVLASMRSPRTRFGCRKKVIRSTWSARISRSAGRPASSPRSTG